MPLFRDESAPGGGPAVPSEGNTSGGDGPAPAGGGPTGGNTSAPDGGNTSEGDGPAPAGGNTSGGDAAPTGTGADVALQVRRGELVIAGQFELTDAAITPEKLDAGTEAKRRAMRDRIEAEGRLEAGTGIIFSAPDADGRRRIATANPHSRAGGDLDADDTYLQPPLDPMHAWRLEVSQLIKPHLVRMEYYPATKKYISDPFSIREMVTGRLEYQRVDTDPPSTAGKVSLTTTPTRTLATLLGDKGRTVNKIFLQIFATKEEAKESTAEPKKAEKIAIQYVKSSSSMVATTALTGDPEPMAPPTPPEEVYALVNFGFTRSDRLTGWERDNANDIARSDVREADSNISPGSMAVIDNGVVLIANAVPSPGTKIWAFKKDGKRLEGWDISQVNAAQGMTYDAPNKKLYVLPSSAGGIDVYRLSINSGTNTLSVNPAESRENVIAATTLRDAYLRDAYGRRDKWHRWGIALLDDYLYVGYHDGKIRCFNKDTGAHVKARDLENIDVKYVNGLTAVGNYLAFGGPTEDGITLWDVAGKKPAPELVITASELKTVNEYFDISAIAYNSTDQRLYVMDHSSDYVIAFAASNRAYPNSEHRFRTMDRDRLRAEVREDHGMLAVDKLPQPGTAGRVRGAVG